MRIRARIQFNIILSIVLVAMVGLLLYLSIQAMNEASGKAGIAAEIVKSVIELKILTSEYLLHPGERVLIQWRSRYDSVIGHLIGGYFRSPDEKIAVDLIVKHINRIKTIFDEITFGVRKKQRPNKQESTVSLVLQDMRNVSIKMRHLGQIIKLPHLQMICVNYFPFGDN